MTTLAEIIVYASQVMLIIRAFRLLTILDEFTRECLAMELARRMSHRDVMDRLADWLAQSEPSQLSYSLFMGAGHSKPKHGTTRI